MERFKGVVTLLAIAMMLVGLAACDREVTRIESSDQPLGCADCHVDNNLITGKQTQWAGSLHATGDAYLRGTSQNCAGCHSGNAFQERIEAGLDPDELKAGDIDPTRQDCRACHQIHKTYTMNDFALTSEAPVKFYAIANSTFDGGDGNLCVNCHQPRRDFPGPDDEGIVKGISGHWGPHHGPQSSMMLGVGGAGVSGSPSGHYRGVVDTCVGCHMGENRNHSMTPSVATCKGCHTKHEPNNFDVDGVQSEIEELTFQLGERLLAYGLINENSEDGHPEVSSAPEDEAVALWNWIYVSHEDKSKGVHNYEYTKALLEEGLERLPELPAKLPASK